MHHAVHHQIAGGLTGVDIKPRRVNTTHHIQATLFLIDMRLLGSGFQRPTLFLGVAVAVTGHNLGAAIGGIDLHDVGHGLGVTVRIIGDNHPLGHIGCDGILLHRCDMIAGTGDAAALGQTAYGSCQQKLILGHLLLLGNDSGVFLGNDSGVFLSRIP